MVRVEPVPGGGGANGPDPGAAAIVADAASGRLTWTADSDRARAKGPRVAPLPGRGPGAVGKVVAATYVHGEPGLGGVANDRLLFVSEDGRCLWRSRLYPAGGLQRTWPLADLARLEKAGVRVTAERFASARDVNRAYPGAAPLAQWFSPPRVYLVGTLVALLLFGATLLLV